MDRYDFPYRPDMRPGERDEKSNDYADLCRQRVPADVKFAIVMFIVAIFISFGAGETVGAAVQQTQSAVACQPH